MKKVLLPGTTFECSKFVFGTASLFNVGSKRRRVGLLDAAIDHGFTHFDTAPYYGFGIAERDLADVLRRHHNVTVTTKVGLYSRGGEMQSTSAVFARKFAGRFAPVLSRPMVNFEVARARTALDGSLRRLARERVDLYLLHEPLVELLDTDEWLGWLNAERQRGRVGGFGVALTGDQLTGFLARKTPLAAFVQVHDSLDRREADVLLQHSRPLQITYGYVSAARARNDGRAVWEILSSAVARNSTGAIIVSTKRIDRLGQYARLAETLA